MGPAYINYIASVVFASMTFALFFQYFHHNRDRISMLLVILGSSFAWAAAYTGATYSMHGAPWGTISAALTTAIIVVILSLLILAIRSAFNG